VLLAELLLATAWQLAADVQSTATLHGHASAYHFFNITSFSQAIVTISLAASGFSVCCGLPAMWCSLNPQGRGIGVVVVQQPMVPTLLGLAFG
jgi:hypothetical protein